MYMYIYIHVYVYVDMNMYTNIYTDICTYIYIWVPRALSAHIPGMFRANPRSQLWGVTFHRTTAPTPSQKLRKNTSGGGTRPRGLRGFRFPGYPRVTWPYLHQITRITPGRLTFGERSVVHRVDTGVSVGLDREAAEGAGLFFKPSFQGSQGHYVPDCR